MLGRLSGHLVGSGGSDDQSSAGRSRSWQGVGSLEGAPCPASSERPRAVFQLPQRGSGCRLHGRHSDEKEDVDWALPGGAGQWACQALGVGGKLGWAAHCASVFTVYIPLACLLCLALAWAPPSPPPATPLAPLRAHVLQGLLGANPDPGLPPHFPLWWFLVSGHPWPVTACPTWLQVRWVKSVTRAWPGHRLGNRWASFDFL